MKTTSWKDDEGVSPVIGVILMVAITVIIAAIIAAFVFGMAGNIRSSKTVGISLNLNANGQGVATIAGGTDLPSLNAVNYSINGGTEHLILDSANISVGKFNTTSEAIAKGSRVMLIGYFNDGTSEILVDKQF